MKDSALQELLAAHARGELDDDAVVEAAANPVRAAGALAARAVLKRARGAGHLPEALYERLLGVADEADDTQTRDDATRLLPGGTRTASPADGDLTRVLPGGTAAVARGRTGTGPTTAPESAPSTTPRGGTAGDDATVVVGGDGGPATTGQSPASATTDDSDTTAIHASPSESATAVAGIATSRADDGELGAGDEIKGRFRLLEPLGQGGMGTIWKAVDKRREEARDRNPYMAIKLLAGDFKNHPEAFIALQRECAKQQRLAHPNIATVYDFDRDGDTVFMTMVLLEGQPLDAFIRSLPKGGLPPSEAMPIIEQLAAGLAYAHANGLVHSDLKPGNCYLLDDGNVRLLDFGIARASRTREDAAGETTVFDPGQLGALTPTYATVEMFDGQDPDPRDDIYALGIIAHQLLTGEHPYGKKSAPKAMQLGLVPSPVASLDKRQNRGLRRSLAFLREERTPSVAEFLSELRPRKSRAMPIAVGSIVVVLVVAALAWKPAQEYLRKQENDEIIAIFTRGDEASINAGLARVEQLPDPVQRQQIAEDPRTRDAIIGLYVQRRQQHFDPAAGRYDYAAGEQQMELLAGLYPDSAEVLKTRNEYQAARDRLLTELDARLRDALEQRRLLPDADGEDVADLLDIVHSVAPGHALLRDAGVAAAFVAAATESSATGDWEDALRLLQTGDSLSPGNASLADALVSVRAELARQREAARVVALRERWQSGVQTLADATVLDAATAELAELQALAPWEPLFDELEAVVDPLLEQRVETMLAAGDGAGARDLLARHGPFASVAMLVSLREQLGEVAAPRMDTTAASAALDATLAGEPDSQGQWRGSVSAALKALLASTARGDSVAVAGQAAVAARLQGLTSAALDEERFAVAAQWLSVGERLAPDVAASWQAARERLASMQVAASERAAAAERAALLAQLRARVETLAAAGEARAAREALAAYAAEAGAGDGYAASDGARAVAGAYLAMAGVAGGVEEALVLVREGLEVAPDDALLRERSQGLAAQVLERALTLGVVLATGRAAPMSALPVTRAAPATSDAGGVSPVEAVRGLPPAYPALGDRLLARVVDELITAAAESSATGDWEDALRLLQTGDSLSPGNASLADALVSVRAELARQREAARVVALRERWQSGVQTLADATALDAATAELAELQALAPWEPLFDELEAVVDPLLEQRVETMLAAGDGAGARDLLARHGPFASVAMLVSLREQLGEVAAPRMDTTAASAALDATLAGEPDSQGQWRGSVSAALKALLASTARGDSVAVAGQAAVAARLQGLTSAALDEERFAVAAQWLSVGERLAPDVAASWQAARERLASMQVAASERAAAAERAALLAQLRARVETLAAAGEARAAREALAAYAAEAGAGDGYAASDGARAVAGAYLAMAGVAGGVEEALVLVREGLEVAPDDALLRERSQGLAAQVLERALTLGVVLATGRAAPMSALPVTRAAPATSDAGGVSPVEAVRGLPPAYPALDVAGARVARTVLAERAADSRDLAALEVSMLDYDVLYPSQSEDMREQVGGALVRAIADNTRVARDGLGALKRTATEFRTLFPAQWTAFSDAVGSRIGREIEGMQGEDLQRAHSMLASARAVLGSSSPLDRIRLKALPKPSKYAPVGFEQLEAGLLGAAQQTYSRMTTEEADHEQLPVFRGALEQRLGEAREYYDAFQRYLRARRKREGQPYLQHALTLWSDNTEWRAEYTRQYETEAERQGACNERLAGYGRRSRGTCYDETPAGERGPVLVVVPAGGSVTKPFAIGKFEVSVGEYNDYCRQSGACRPATSADASLPITGIRAADAEAYAGWLSKQTGAVYRLPTATEWSHAAEAGGKQPRKDFNCRVTSGGSIIKGHGLVDVQSGQQNGWGLANYIGNAQEWARNGDRLSVHGGAFEDPLARCEPDLRRDHDGNADTVTGFRLLRELS